MDSKTAENREKFCDWPEPLTVGGYTMQGTQLLSMIIGTKPEEDGGLCIISTDPAGDGAICFLENATTNGINTWRFSKTQWDAAVTDGSITDIASLITKLKTDNAASF